MSKVRSNLDFGKNQALNLVTQNLAAAPSSPVAGLRYYDTVLATECFYNGSAWIPADAAKRTGIPLTNLATDPLARANHTGTQLAATISDFSTAVKAVSGIPVTNLSVDPLARANHTGTQTASTISDFATTVRGTTAFPITNLTVDPLARANHTGTQTASTISDLATVVKGYTLDSFAAPVAAVSLSGQRLINVGAPSASTDGVNKGYVDGLIQGVTTKPAAMAVTTGALPSCTYANGASGVGATLTATANGVLTVDGYAVALNDLVLVNQQASGFQNGLYQVTTLGTASVPFVLTRVSGMDSATEFGGALIPVESAGATLANSLWLCTNAANVTVGTTAITFTRLNTPYSLTAGNGLQLGAGTMSVLLPASSGLSASGSGLQIDTTVVVRKYAVAVPSGTTTPVVTHNLNTLDVTVQVYEVATGDEVMCDINRTSVNTVTLGFAVAPTSNQYRVVIHG